MSGREGGEGACLLGYLTLGSVDSSDRTGLVMLGLLAWGGTLPPLPETPFPQSLITGCVFTEI